MVNACIFGDRFLASGFRAADEYVLIDCLILCSSSYYQVIIQAYEHLPATSMVLKVMVETHCHMFHQSADKKADGEARYRAQLPYRFLLSVMLRYAAIKEKHVPEWPVRSDYHGRTLSKGDCLEVDQDFVNDIGAGIRKGPAPTLAQDIAEDMGFGLFD